MNTYIIVIKRTAGKTELKAKGVNAQTSEGFLRIFDEENFVVAGVPIENVVCWYKEGPAAFE